MAEGVVMIRRSAFDAAGGWPGNFLLSHEGIDLAWRLWDRGERAGTCRTSSSTTPRPPPPATTASTGSAPAAASDFTRRNLPAPLIPLNLATFVLLALWRLRSKAALRATAAGFREGLRGSHGQRASMSWRTDARLTRAGRPRSSDPPGAA
ncbi:hypothetical protein AB1388_26595 [Streptomyces hydrogenans]|uniref:glycosyltransferase family 2 protein n=1 Tax=Streptomyces hydrogenans TaxID=1873719 RepID=UPI00345DA609